MQKKIFSFSLILGMVTSIPAVAGDLCVSLEGRALSITANGHKASVATYVPGLHLLKAADGTYTFETAIHFENEKPDKLTGECKDRHIQLKRARKGGFVQDYDGWIFEKGGSAVRGMAGNFSHNGVKKWSWCGQIILAAPK